MRKKVRYSFVAIVVLMSALALTALTASHVEALGGGCKTPCPQPPEGCTFLGCDRAGNCMYQCCQEPGCF